MSQSLDPTAAEIRILLKNLEITEDNYELSFWPENELDVLVDFIMGEVKRGKLDEVLEMRAVGDRYVTSGSVSFEGLSGAYDAHILKRAADLTSLGATGDIS